MSSSEHAPFTTSELAAGLRQLIEDGIPEEIRQFRDDWRSAEKLGAVDSEGGHEWRAAVTDRIIDLVQNGSGNIGDLVESWLFYVQAAD